MIEVRYNLNMVPDKGSPIHINVSQNDDKCRTFIFKLYSSDGSWTAPASATATIEGRKDDGKFFSFACTYSNGEVTVIVQQQMVAVAGKVRCKIKLVSGAETIESAPFYFVVNPKSMPVNADMSKSDVVDAVAKATQKIVDQVAGSIPQDYVKLNEDVSGLKSDVTNFEASMNYNSWSVGFINNGISLDNNSDSTRRKTSFIMCHEGCKVIARGESNNSYVAFLKFYDENKNVISCISGLGAEDKEYEIDAPENCAYVRCSALKTQVDSGTAKCFVFGGTVAKLRELIYENRKENDHRYSTLSFGGNIDFSTVGYVALSTGGIVAQSGFVLSNFVLCYPKTIIKHEGLVYNNSYVASTAFYDFNKRFISASNESKEVIAPESTCYVRFSKTTNSIAEISYDTVSTFEYLKDHILLFDNLDEIALLKQKTANIFNKDNVTKDSFTQGSIVLGSAKKYNASDYIKVKPNTHYAHNTHNAIGSKIEFYNKFKQIIYSIDSKGVYDFITPSECQYVRLSVTDECINNFMLIEGDELPQFYVPYSDFEPLQKVETKVENLENLVNVKNKSIQAFANDLSDEMKLTTSRVKYNYIIGFHAKVNSMGEITIGKGITAAYSSGYVKIDSTSITVGGYSTSEFITKQVAHGLSLEGNIDIIIKQGVGNADIIVTSKGMTFSVNANFNGSYTKVTASSNGGDYEKCVLTFYCEDYNKPVWAFGDSYFDMYPSRVYGLGFTNWLVDGISGSGSSSAYNSLVESAKYAKPKYILWCMGMNDADSDTEINASWLDTINKLLSFCNMYDVTPIFCTIPNVPSRNHSFKNEWVRSSGYRYVDLCEVVGADLDSNWYSGLLGGDKVHPSDKGQIAIANRIITDVPELVDVSMS